MSFFFALGGVILKRLGNYDFLLSKDDSYIQFSGAMAQRNKGLLGAFLSPHMTHPFKSLDDLSQAALLSVK